MSSSSPYGTRTGGGAHGDVFTKREVVSFMLDLVGYVPTRNLSCLRVLEPSCGEGEFVLEILRRLELSSKKFCFDVAEAARKCVFAYEIDAAKIAMACQRIVNEMPQLGDMLEIFHNEDFLKSSPPMVDIVVGNPPYVRYEQLSQETIDFCKRNFPTFHYRADLYVPFYEKTLRLLNPEGKHCFICSNRWMKNEYGKVLRRMIATMFDLEYVADLERVMPFQENVMAYTDIVVVRASQRSDTFRFVEISDLNELGDKEQERALPMPEDDDWCAAFNHIGQQDGLFFIEELGLKIGIGVATGADDIFISNDLVGRVEHELLLPLVCGKDLRGNAFRWSGKYLLNPFLRDGSLINLDSYPGAKRYLMQHEEVLKGRHVAKKNKKTWYRTIDRVRPELQCQPKILLPDMTANTRIFVDSGSYYPSHNIYYITGTDEYHLKLLSAVLMSDLTKRQLSSVSNSMNGGFMRWQSQNLHKIRVPDIFSMTKTDAEEMIKAYEISDMSAINRLSVKASLMKTVSRKSRLKRYQKELCLSLF